MPEPTPATPDPSTVDTALLDRLRTLWSERDPVPADLVDDLVAAIAVADLDGEWLLLEPADSDLAGGALVGVRGGSDVATVQFQLGDVRLVLRVSAQAHGRSRLDGWVTGIDAGDGAAVHLTTPTSGSAPAAGSDEVVSTSALDRHGRFAFPDVGRGRSWQLRLDLGGHGRRFQTPSIDC